MGGDTDIRKAGRDNLAPDATSTFAQPHSNEVASEDSIGRIRGFSGWYGQMVITGEEFFSWFWEEVNKEIGKPNLWSYVMSTDDGVNVAKKGMKGDTQKKRKAVAEKQRKRNNEQAAILQEEHKAKRQRKGELNPQELKSFDAEFEMQIKELDKEEQERIDKEEEEEEMKKNPRMQNDLTDQPYPYDHVIEDEKFYLEGKYVGTHFDLRRILVSNRKPLLTYVNRRLCSKVIPKGKQLVFEWDVSGPWFHRGNSHKHRTDLAHNHGEFDTSMIFWADYFERFPFRIKSEDTDVIDLVAGLLIYRKNNNKLQGKHQQLIQWEYRNSETKPLQRFGPVKANIYVVNMNLFYKGMLSSLKMCLEEFFVAFIAAGTDFHIKKENPDFMFRGLNWRHVFEGIRLFTLHYNKKETPGMSEADKWITIFALACSAQSSELPTKQVKELMKSGLKDEHFNPEVRKVEYATRSVERLAGVPIAVEDILIRKDKKQRYGVQTPTPQIVEKTIHDIKKNCAYWLYDWQSGDRKHIEEDKERMWKEKVDEDIIEITEGDGESKYDMPMLEKLPAAPMSFLESIPEEEGEMKADFADTDMALISLKGVISDIATEARTYMKRTKSLRDDNLKRSTINILQID